MLKVPQSRYRRAQRNALSVAWARPLNLRPGARACLEVQQVVEGYRRTKSSARRSTPLACTLASAGSLPPPISAANSSVTCEMMSAQSTGPFSDLRVCTQVVPRHLQLPVNLHLMQCAAGA